MHSSNFRLSEFLELMIILEITEKSSHVSKFDCHIRGFKCCCVSAKNYFGDRYMYDNFQR